MHPDNPPVVGPAAPAPRGYDSFWNAPEPCTDSPPAYAADAYAAFAVAADI